MSIHHNLAILKVVLILMLAYFSCFQCISINNCLFICLSYSPYYQAMESDCLELLPSVLEVLSDSKLLLHDDTSLEKLLDCFKDLIVQSKYCTFKWK